MAKTPALVAVEYEKKTNATKKVFYYKDEEYKIDQVSREVFLKEDKLTHYPTPFRGDYKYKTIRKFTYIGFNEKITFRCL